MNPRHLRHSLSPTALLAAAAGFAVAASAALGGVITVTPIVVEGDLYNSFPISSGFSASETHAVNNAGVWFVESDTTNPDTDADGLIVTGTGAAGPRSVAFTHGQALTAPAGVSISSFDSISVNASGNTSSNFFLAGTAGGMFDSGVFFNSSLVIQESAATTAPGLSAGTPYIGWFETRINDQDQILMMSSIDDAAIASTVDRAIVIVDNPGGAYTETLIAKEGDELVAGRFVADFSTNAHSLAFRNNSRIAFIADLGDPSTDDGAIFHYDGSTLHLLAREASPSAIEGRNWGTLLGTAIDINNSGDWAMRGDLDGATTDDSMIVRNGTDVIAREGSPVPSAIGAFNFTTFGTGAVLIADDGDVIYVATWNDTDTARNQGIFVNDELVVQKGVTVIDGLVLTSMAAGESNMSASPDGRFIVFEGTLSDGRDGAFLVDRGEESCPADFDQNGVREVPDIFAFLSAWFASDPSAEFDGTPGITVPDIFAFLSLWFAGCP